MAWRTCAPFLPRSTHGCARGLGQKDAVRDPNFFASALDHLTWLVDGKKVHVAGQIFSGDGIRQATRNSNTGDLPPSRSCPTVCKARCTISQLHTSPSGPTRHVRSPVKQTVHPSRCDPASAPHVSFAFLYPARVYNPPVP